MRDRDQYFLTIAVAVAARATCLRRAVGCVLVDQDYHILATGYNGPPAGLQHCNEQTGFNSVYANGIDKRKPLTGQSTGQEPVFGNACPGARTQASGAGLEGCFAVHAEQNALLQCPDVRLIKTCYVTHSPCIHCVKMLMNTACCDVVFNEPYAHDAQARELWMKPRARAFYGSGFGWRHVPLSAG